MRLEVWMGVALLATAATAHAQWQAWDAEFDEDAKSWKEIQAKIPPYPKGDNLLRVEAGSATSHQFFIDPASLSVGEDGVVRYTTVVKSAGGAINVTFHGMRCETREGKLYAIGHRDGTWARARDPQWKRILLRDLTPHHFVLYREYFCPSPSRPTPVNIALDALRRGVGLAPGATLD